MILNFGTRVENEDGKYLVMEDNGSEGFGVIAQCDDLEGALAGLAGSYSSSVMVLELVAICVESSTVECEK